MLLEHDADANEPNDTGYTPPASPYPFLVLVSRDKNKISLLKLFLSYNPQLDTQENRKGYTPLHSPVDTDDGELIKILIEHGADPHIKEETPSLRFKLYLKVL